MTACDGLEELVRERTRELEIANSRLLRSNQQLEMAQCASGAGTWDWDITTGQIEWSHKLFELFGIDQQGNAASFESWNAVIHPEDREAANSRIDRALRDHKSLDSEYRIIRPDGEIRWINAMGEGVYDDQGQAVRMIGICIDITERKQAEEALQEANEELEVTAEELRQQNDELMRTHSALLESEERYRALFNRMTEGFALHEIICDENGEPYDYRFLDVNPAFEQLTGLKREDVIGRTHNEILPNDDARWVREYGAVALTGNPTQFENYSSALGRDYEVFAYCPAPRQFAVLFMDITERKRSEEVLQTALERFYTVLSSMYAAILLVTEKGRIEFANQSFCNLFDLKDSPASLTGLTSSELIGKIKNVYMRPDEEVARIGEIVDQGEPVIGEEIAMQGGRTCLRDFIPICIDGNSYGRLWHHLEITDLKRREEQIAKLTRLYMMLSQVNEAIVRIGDERSLLSEVCRIVAKEGGFPLVWIGQVKGQQVVPVAWSGPAADYLKEIKVEVQGDLGRGPTGTCICEDRPAINDDFATNPATSPWREPAKRYGFRASAAFPLHRQSKAVGAFTLYSSDPDAFDEEQVGLLESLSSDISFALDALDQERFRAQAEQALARSRDDLERRVQQRTAELQGAKEEMEIANEELQVELEQHQKLEADLIKAKDAAEEAAEAKAAFLANMSHELRTPMNAVIGFTSLLLEEPLTSDQKDYIEGIRNGGEALLGLINEILDFSRADKEKVVLEHQPFSLKHCIESSFDMVASQANQKGLNLSYTISYGTPDAIIGDPGRLRQVLVNLLGNAVKFTDEGEVSIIVSAQAGEGDKQKFYFSVRDTGIGLQPDKLDKIFEPFTQAERVISRKRDGVGLGLAISKKLVELMGGRIWAESVPGQGSAFHFTIRAEAIEGRHLDLVEANKENAFENLAVQNPLSILVAEDNPSNQRVLVTMLKHMGYRPDAVSDGKEVLQALELRPYDLILMDVKMPEMDGITATQVIRKLQPEKGPKIVAITAYALEGDREKCLEAGMDGYVAKPVQTGELVEVLKRCSQKAQ
jgi:PAS domain S-box-containing protein